jgi:hypothetical protein
LNTLKACLNNNNIEKSQNNISKLKGDTISRFAMLSN